MKYKRYLVITLVIIHSSSLATSRHDFKVILESQWKNLENENDTAHKVKHFDGKWILVESITFKKSSKEAINLHKLTLQWHGPHISTITASLYHKKPDKEFRPIQDFLICDGVWHAKSQTLFFNFEKQCTLSASDTFYLVLTVPPVQEEMVKRGSFTLINNCLPEHFEHYLIENKMSLSCNSLKKN